MAILSVMRWPATLSLAALLVGAFAGPSTAVGQAYPNRPIKMIVPHAPGGVTDVVTRIMAQPLSEALGQTVVVENRPGASGLVGTEVAAKAAPDGYTLLQFVDTNTIFPSVQKQIAHDPAGSFSPVTLLVRGSHVIIAHPSVPANTLQELVAYAKSRPGEVAFASPGVGSPQHLAAEILQSSTGIKLIHVPFKGGGQAIGDVVGGHVPLGLLGMAPTLPFVRDGKLKVIAVTGATRSPLLPNSPTVAESGVPGFQTIQWQGLVVPAGTPAAIIERLHAETVKVMQMPAVLERLKSVGMEVATNTPDQFRAMIAEELKRWPAVVAKAGIVPE
jgi:tripartite-type tricarboxylate transporter receptor subunit TctC